MRYIKCSETMVHAKEPGSKKSVPWGRLFYHVPVKACMMHSAGEYKSRYFKGTNQYERCLGCTRWIDQLEEAGEDISEEELPNIDI